MNETTGVLLMAYGTPRNLDDVEAYYTDIRHGRPPSPEALSELTERYRAIGGRSPLLDITEAQARALEQNLNGIPVYIGQKHAAPFIRDAVKQMADDGVEHAVGLVLAPHYSSMSIGDYARRTAAAADEIGWTGKFEMIESWHLAPGYVDLLVDRVRAAQARLSGGAREWSTVVFTAHSLPESILKTGDPYPEQLAETASVVAQRGPIDRWRIGWQSAGRTDAAWLGPDILEVVEDLATHGERGVVVCPCGFVADHLEVLYDIDIEAKALADKLGIELVRTASPNDDPPFISVLADVVRRHTGL
ncbi:MAG: ferrochelatase [Actinomycetota bacterium]